MLKPFMVVSVTARNKRVRNYMLSLLHTVPMRKQLQQIKTENTENK